MKTPTLLLVACLGLVLVGCKKDEPSSNGSTSTATATATPARQTSFTEVTGQLDPGGNVYAYLATDQWLTGISTNITRLKDFLLSLPDVAEPDSEKINAIFDLLAGGVAKSGLENLTGVGLSSVQISPELHRTKLILHHRKGEGDGLFWNVMGKEPHALTGLDFLTTNTAVAAFGDLDIAALWQALDSSLTRSGVPELSDGIKQWPAQFEKHTQLSWPKLLESFGGELGLVLTLDHATQISLPLGEGIKLPTPGLLLAFKVNDDLLYQRISSELKKSQMVELTDEKDLQMCAMPIPLPLPVALHITVAFSGDYFFVATSPTMVRNALAVRAGKQPGLRQTPEFAALLKHLPAQGNQLIYADKRFSGMVMELQKQVMAVQKSKSESEPEAAAVDAVWKLLINQNPTFGLSIGARTATGWQSVSVGNQDSPARIRAAVPALGAAMLLPALAKAKTKAQSISCMNNMKQLGLAFRIWAVENEDQFSFNVSTSKSGSLELCERGGDGYDRNAYRHFQVMSNELISPKILICPGDSGKQAAADFSELELWNVSYQLRTGPNVSDVNPDEILTYCPIHHHVGRTDGSVQSGTQSKR